MSFKSLTKRPVRCGKGKGKGHFLTSPGVQDSVQGDSWAPTWDAAPILQARWPQFSKRKLELRETQWLTMHFAHTWWHQGWSSWFRTFNDISRVWPRRGWATHLEASSTWVWIGLNQLLKLCFKDAWGRDGGCTHTGKPWCPLPPSSSSSPPASSSLTPPHPPVPLTIPLPLPADPLESFQQARPLPQTLPPCRCSRCLHSQLC